MKRFLPVLLAAVLLLALCASAQAAEPVDAAAFVWDNSTYYLRADNALWRAPNSGGSHQKVLSNVASAIPSDGCAFAVTLDHALYAWGTLPDGTVSSVPKKIMDGVKRVIAEDSYFENPANYFVIRTDNSLWGWGGNEYGELGNGTRTASAVPVKILENVRDFVYNNEVLGTGSIRPGACYAICTDDSLWTWGNSYCARLGHDGSTEHSDCWPTPKKLLDNVASVCVSDDYQASAIQRDGSLWVWGNDISNLKPGDPGTNTVMLTARWSPEMLVEHVAKVDYSTATCAYLTQDGRLYVSTRKGTTLAAENVVDFAISFEKLYIIRSDGAFLVRDGEDASFRKLLDNAAAISPNTGWQHALVYCADGTLWSGSAQGMSRLADSVRLPASTGIVIPPPDTPFVDVPSSAYYHDAVVWAVKQNVTNGVDDTHFGPDSSCTRAQMVTFLWRAEGSPEPTGAQNDYSDVTVGTYYEKAVRWAAEQGITNGTAPNRFSPDAPVTRAQTVTFLWRMESGQNASGAIPFVDVPAGAYYTEAVAWAVEHGVTNGTDQTHFSPDANCTRAQIVTFLYRDLKS